jgi:hypothetical protein
MTIIQFFLQKMYSSFDNVKYLKVNLILIKRDPLVQLFTKFINKKKDIVFKMGRSKTFWYHIIETGSAVSCFDFCLINFPF